MKQIHVEINDAMSEVYSINLVSVPEYLHLIFIKNNIKKKDFVITLHESIWPDQASDSANSGSPGRRAFDSAMRPCKIMKEIIQ